MADKPDKWVKLVSDLIERTQQKKLKWMSYVPKDPVRIKVVYRTTHKEKGLRLYKREAAQSDVAVFINAFGNAREAIVLEVIDDQQNTLWNFPELPALYDLYEAVRYQIAGIDEFFADLLRD